MINIEKLKNIIIEAGNIGLKIYNDKKVDFELKDDNSFVTLADKETEKFLFEKLNTLFPATFIGEEGNNLSTKENPEYVWAIDPIDGTHSFASQLPGWCVSIGLLKNFKPYFGIVYSPVTDELYWGGKEFGAFFNNRKITVCLTEDDFQSNHNVFVDSKASKYLPKEFKAKFRSFGSTALHILYVSRCAGVAGYTKPVKIWDIAGAAAILEASGGELLYIDKSKVDYKEIIENGECKMAMVFGSRYYAEKLADEFMKS
ncbi:MAG: inositol monophosphatase [Candidatus Muiribacteriota bacterium]